MSVDTHGKLDTLVGIPNSDGLVVSNAEVIMKSDKDNGSCREAAVFNGG